MNKERQPDIFTQYVNKVDPKQTVTVHDGKGKVKVMPSDDVEAEAWIVATTRPQSKELGS